jgi:hypothetical protein
MGSNRTRGEYETYGEPFAIFGKNVAVSRSRTPILIDLSVVLAYFFPSTRA